MNAKRCKILRRLAEFDCAHMRTRYVRQRGTRRLQFDCFRGCYQTLKREEIKNGQS